MDYALLVLYVLGAVPFYALLTSDHDDPTRVDAFATILWPFATFYAVSLIAMDHCRDFAARWREADTRKEDR